MKSHLSEDTARVTKGASGSDRRDARRAARNPGAIVSSCARRKRAFEWVRSGEQQLLVSGGEPRGVEARCGALKAP